MRDFEGTRLVHPAVRPVKPCVMSKEIEDGADGEIPERIVADVGVNAGPAVMLPSPCNDPGGNAVNAGAQQAPPDFAADLRAEVGIEAGAGAAGGPRKRPADDQVADADDERHDHGREDGDEHCRCFRPLTDERATVAFRRDSAEYDDVFLVAARAINPPTRNREISLSRKMTEILS